MKSIVEPSASGEWRVERFTVARGTASAIFNMKNHGRGVVVGEEYTRLMRGNAVVMSDTPAEIRDLIPLKFCGFLGGHVLINGLGLGLAVQVALDGGAERVTVVEISRDVINLTEPYFNDERVEIIHADSFNYKPPKGVRYSAVWHDIWDNICADNLPEMSTLHRKYGRRTDWQGSWCRSYCEKQRDQLKKNFYT